MKTFTSFSVIGALIILAGLVSCNSRGNANAFEEKGGVMLVVKVQPEGIPLISERLSGAGFKDFNVSTMDDGAVQVKVAGVKDKELITKYFIKRPVLEIWETYNKSDAVSPDLIMKSYDILKGAFLWENNDYSALLGYAKDIDTARINSFFALEEVKSLLPEDFHAMWTAKPVYNGLYELMALRGDGPALDQSCITDSYAKKENYGAVVGLTMSEEGKGRWAYITKANIGRQIALTVGGKVYSYPNVHDEIRTGNCVISGDFSLEEAKNLAQIIKTGNFPIPVQIVGAEYVPAKPKSVQ
ncbi:MAG: hypothetical protein IJ151_07275 [Bacteroidales bacterium]|nr:hypothetical protein [Bacteroidales bacterium]